MWVFDAPLLGTFILNRVSIPLQWRGKFVSIKKSNFHYLSVCWSNTLPYHFPDFLIVGYLFRSEQFCAISVHLHWSCVCLNQVIHVTLPAINMHFPEFTQVGRFDIHLWIHSVKMRASLIDNFGFQALINRAVLSLRLEWHLGWSLHCGHLIWMAWISKGWFHIGQQDATCMWTPMQGSA